jgi:hypothetical protein
MTLSKRDGKIRQRLQSEAQKSGANTTTLPKQRSANAIKARRPRYDNAVKAMHRETKDNAVKYRRIFAAAQIRQRCQSEDRYTTTLFIIKRSAQQMILRHCQISKAQRYETLSKRSGSRDVMTHTNMMTLFNLLKRLINDAKVVLVGSPCSIITLLKITT